MQSVSPGPATIRLMKFWSERPGVASGQACRGGCGTPHSVAVSAPAGGWKTTMSPIAGSVKW